MLETKEDIEKFMAEKRYFILTDDRKVIPADLLTWAKFFEDTKKRIVDQTVLEDIKISTVFPGLNHAMPWNNELEIFETMIFGGSDEIDESQWRYSTWDEAVAGHQNAIEIVKKELSLGQRIK